MRADAAVSGLVQLLLADTYTPGRRSGQGRKRNGKFGLRGVAFCTAGRFENVLSSICFAATCCNVGLLLKTNSRRYIEY